MSATVGIIGLGLIGGSLARDLAAAGYQVLAHDKNADILQNAHAHAGITAADADLSGVTCDVVIIATPIREAIATLRGLDPRHLLITDVSSTKRSICAAAEALGLANFVGSHPMTGDHRSGWAASRTGMFKDAGVYLCGTRATTPSTIDAAERLWRSLGGIVELIDAERHDAQLAWTSHLPQLISSLLAVALARAGHPRNELGPGGRDVTRLAGSNAELWYQILLDNADNVDVALDALNVEIAELRTALATSDQNALRALLKEGSDWSVAPTTPIGMPREKR